MVKMSLAGQETVKSPPRSIGSQEGPPGFKVSIHYLRQFLALAPNWLDEEADIRAIDDSGHSTRFLQVLISGLGRRGQATVGSGPGTGETGSKEPDCNGSNRVERESDPSVLHFVTDQLRSPGSLPWWVPGYLQEPSMDALHGTLS